MPNQRLPSGTLMLAVLLLLLSTGGALLGLIGTLLGLWMNAMDVAAAARGISGTPIGSMLIAIGVGAIAMGVFGLITAYGLFKLKQYGWYLAVAFLISSLGLSLFILFHRVNILGGIMAIAMTSAFLYDLFRPSVKRAFGRAIADPGKTQRLK